MKCLEKKRGYRYYYFVTTCKGLELKDYGVLIDMYRGYREKRRKQHKRKVTERDLQLEFFYLYSEKIRQECKGIIYNYNYKLEIRKPAIINDEELRQKLHNIYKKLYILY